MALMDFLGKDFFGDAAGYGDLLSEEQKRKMQQQAIMQMGASLLQASGPSRQRIGLGQALGSAYQAGQQAYGQAGQNALQQMLTKQKIDEYQRGLKTQQTIQDLLLGNQGAAATAAPTQTGQAAPAARTGAQPDNRAAMAQKYRQLAMVLAPVDQTKANAYLTMADKLSPVVKPQGQPFEVRDPKNPRSNILVQGFSDGTIKPVQGYSPAGMNEYQQQQLAISLANLGISQEQLARGEYTLQQTADGFAYVPKKPGLPVVPVSSGVQTSAVPGQPAIASAQLKPAGAKPTSDQSNAVGFAQRMERADAILSSLEGNQPGAGSMLAGSLPFVGGYAQRKVMSPQQQQFKQAADDWIRAKLRKESGAAIGDAEMENEYQTYFPMPGDDEQVIAQKADARRIATQAMQQSAGEFYKPWTPSETDALMLKEQKQPGSTTGKLKWDPQRGWVME